MDTRPIRFLHRGQVVEVTPDRSTRSVLDWLREDARCTGTKEGCAEGDCGACTVVVGALDGHGRLQLRSENACIRFLPQLDGKALYTVEDLSPPQGPLHPVQQALVDGHGSQCGFCTPGFVMTLWACQQHHAAAGTKPTRQQLADELSGNLCRCTGYRPILDAGEQLFRQPAPPFDTAPVEAALQQLAADPPLALQAGDGSRMWAPRTLDELARLRAERPQARLLAGATDIGLWVNKQLRELPELIAVDRVPELQALHDRDGVLHIGAAVSLEAAWAALARHWPPLGEVWRRFASPPVRHAGTMGGNVANGSPIGDAAPVLMALGAQLVLQRLDVQRTLPLAGFYTSYMTSQLQPGEFVHSLQVPLPAAGTVLRAYKISKRFDSDISALCAGLALDLDGDRIVAARLAFGGLAATVMRAAAAEAALVGQCWAEPALQAAAAALAHDFQPLSDLRASAGYRLQVAQNLLRRFWLETRPDAPLAAAQLSVFARGEAA